MNEVNIKARTAGGMRDLLPEEFRQREWIVNTVTGVYEDFGFVPIETPTIEFQDVLVGQGNDFNIFRIDSKTEREPLALRFDLTVPLARVVAQYQEIPKPFKRYQFGHVFRGEKPQAGRYREFVQLDADIVGSSSSYADLEVVLMMHEVMKRLGIENYKVRFNSRKILNALPEYANFERSKSTDVMRVLDKIDKIGEEAVFSELQDKEGLYLAAYNCERIKKYLDFSKNDSKAILAIMKTELAGIQTAEEGLRELEIISDGLTAMGIPQDKWVIDPSIARGLAYYTGPVFETYLTDLWKIGSVFSGGRYDGLINRFSSDSIPATGASVGIDRLLTALKELGKLPTFPQTKSVILVAPLSENLQAQAFNVLSILRKADVPCEMYFGKELQPRTQLGYASRKGIKFVALIGESEAVNGTVTLKNMATRNQEIVSLGDIAAFIQK